MDLSFLDPVKFTEHRTLSKKLSKAKRPAEGRRTPREPRSSAYLLQTRMPLILPAMRTTGALCLTTADNEGVQKRGFSELEALARHLQHHQGGCHGEAGPDQGQRDAASVCAEYDSAEESRVISSPTSVLQFRNSQSQSTEESNPVKAEPVEEPPALECQGESAPGLSDPSSFLQQLEDIPFLDEFFNFEAPGTDALFGDPLLEAIFAEDFMNDAFQESGDDLGSAFNVDDYFPDIGELFVRVV
ncbi:hypothetical protein MLD38_031137 [Melastoma candidum]|uniref:Uncharacterized protein n=1 Tax=Melastoma candidum TaxID=119954 RepID=A0ACB9MNU1_9MYRT|nr:hypothetical protein MLD38_031137 [Melastoma candidum]